VKEEPAVIVPPSRSAHARHVADSTTSKRTTIFEQQFLASRGDTGLKELTRERLTARRRG
jgi:hypothetical protein